MDLPTGGRGSRPPNRAPAAPGSLVRSAVGAIAAAWRRALSQLRSSPTLRWEVAAFAGALLVYAITRFWRLADYPIYFFCDEAFQPLSAEDLLRHGLRDANGRLFPVYFRNTGFWVPLFPVYAHVVSVGLFGKSVEVARATAAFFTMLGAAAVGLALKFGFRSRLWWTGPLLLATTPAFFLHSRTTFETVFQASFFACFLLFYLLYRCRSPWFLFPAILFGACAFYSYSVGQVVVTVAAVLLGIVDIRYHVRHWRHVLAGLALLGIVLLPLYRLRKAEPEAAAGQMARVSSYWLEKIPFPEKLLRSAKEYGHGLSPQYWFLPHSEDLSRHTMLGYGHIRTQLLPLVAVGLVVCLWRVRSPPHRAVLIFALAAPSSAILAKVFVTRALSFVVPAAILAAIGAGALLELVRAPKIRRALAAGVFVVLAASSFHLLYDALTNGPRWYHDYQWGQQWGSKQLFEIIPQYLKADSTTLVALTPNWSNGAGLFPLFFLKRGSPAAARVRMESTGDFAAENLAGLSRKDLVARIDSVPRTIFVTTPEELEAARSSGTFSSVRIDRVLNYPDGEPGFYFVRLTCLPDIVERTVAKGQEALRVMSDGQLILDNETLPVRFSRMDVGPLQNLVDGDPKTLVRFNAANPAVLEVRFPRPRPIRKVALTLGSGSWEIRLRLAPAEGVPGQTYSAVDRTLTPDPRIEIPIAKGPPKTGFLRVEIRAMEAGDFAIIHVRELELR